jgi:hypothetical protein
LRQALWLLIAFLALARPVSADNDLVGQQERVKQQLAAAGAAIGQLDQRIAAFDRSIAETDRRILRERQELRLIARTLYAQPESSVMALLSASSLADALTRISDVTAAGDRAAATERALHHDVSSLQADKATLVADRRQADHLRQQLDAQFRLLQGMIDASAAQPPVVPQPAAVQHPPAQALAPPPPASKPPAGAPPPPPPPVPPPPVASGSVQQIILDGFAPLGAAAQAWALRVARCESNFNPYAVNRSSGASGLFQFLPSSWAGTPQGKAGLSVFDANANARGAAWYYNATGRTGGPWSCK